MFLCQYFILSNTFVKYRRRPYTPSMRMMQAILPVAGLGTRFLPWTNVVPKELLPLGTRPMIALLVDECLSVGIREICFVISPGKELIPQYFAPNPRLSAELRKRGKDDLLRELHRYDSVQFHVAYQEEQRGDGHAILQAQGWVKSDPVAILFGDDLILGKESGLEQLAKAYAGLPGGSILLCLENIPRARVQKYGIVAIDESASQERLKKVTHLMEKPSPEEAPSTLCIVGKYIIPRSTFDILTRIMEEGGGPASAKASAGKEIRLVDAFIVQLPTIPVYGYEVEGRRIDTGTPEGYREAVQLLG